jgi:hypothetical protein
LTKATGRFESATRRRGQKQDYGMRMPNAERAFVDMRKLTGYCLDTAHPRGRHKARVFDSALGLTAIHAEALYNTLLDAACTNDAILGELDEYGQRFVIDFEMSGPAGTATVRSSWIVLHSEDFPRFVSCYVV